VKENNKLSVYEIFPHSASGREIFSRKWKDCGGHGQREHCDQQPVALTSRSFTSLRGAVLFGQTARLADRTGTPDSKTAAKSPRLGRQNCRQNPPLMIPLCVTIGNPKYP